MNARSRLERERETGKESTLRPEGIGGEEEAVWKYCGCGGRERRKGPSASYAENSLSSLPWESYKEREKGGAEAEADCSHNFWRETPLRNRVTIAIFCKQICCTSLWQMTGRASKVMTVVVCHLRTRLYLSVKPPSQTAVIEAVYVKSAVETQVTSIFFVAHKLEGTSEV